MFLYAFVHAQSLLLLALKLGPEKVICRIRYPNCNVSKSTEDLLESATNQKVISEDGGEVIGL